MGNENIGSQDKVSNTNAINVPPKDCSEAEVTTRAKVDGYKLLLLTSV